MFDYESNFFEKQEIRILEWDGIGGLTCVEFRLLTITREGGVGTTTHPHMKGSQEIEKQRV